MHIRRLFAALALAPALVFGQLGSGTVTVTSSRTSNPQPDQAVFSVSVASGIDRSLDDIVAALSGTGLSAANLSGVSFQPPILPSPTLEWTFQLVAPLSNIKGTTA